MVVSARETGHLERVPARFAALDVEVRLPYDRHRRKPFRDPFHERPTRVGRGPVASKRLQGRPNPPSPARPRPNRPHSESGPNYPCRLTLGKGQKSTLDLEVCPKNPWDPRRLTPKASSHGAQAHAHMTDRRNECERFRRDAGRGEARHGRLGQAARRRSRTRTPTQPPLPGPGGNTRRRVLGITGSALAMNLRAFEMT
jgi:hypothetical protein